MNLKNKFKDNIAGKLIELFFLAMPLAFIFGSFYYLYHSFKKGILYNVWGKIGVVFVIIASYSIFVDWKETFFPPDEKPKVENHKKGFILPASPYTTQAC